MTQPIDDRGGAKPAGTSPASPGPPAPPNASASEQPLAAAPALSAAEVQEVVEEGRRRFVASFPGRFEAPDGDDRVGWERRRRRPARLAADRPPAGRPGRRDPVPASRPARRRARGAGDARSRRQLRRAGGQPAAGDIWSAFTEERASVATKAPAAGRARRGPPDGAHRRRRRGPALPDVAAAAPRRLQGRGRDEGQSRCSPRPRRSRPAVILLDVQMPDQDGFTTARQLKAHPDTAGIPLMFLTGRSTVDDRLAGLRIGADDYVSKSVDPRELVLRVQKLCDRVPAPVAPAPAGAEPEAARGAAGRADPGRVAPAGSAVADPRRLPRSRPRPAHPHLGRAGPGPRRQRRRCRWGSGSPSSCAAAIWSARPTAASGRCSCPKRRRRAWRRG